MKKFQSIALFAIIVVLVIAQNYLQSNQSEGSVLNQSSQQVQYQAGLNPFLFYQSTPLFLNGDNSLAPSATDHAEISLACCLNVRGVHIPNYIHKAVIQNKGSEDIAISSEPAANTNNVPGVYISKYIKKHMKE